MKNYFISLPVVFLSVIALYVPVANLFSSEKPVTKEINLTISTDNNYTTKVYNNTFASVHVTVIKIRNNKETIVWEKTFDTLELQKYPSQNNAIEQEISIPDVLNSKEKLVVTYTVTYMSGASMLQVVNGEVISKKPITNTLKIPV